MKVEFETYLALLERRLYLLRALAERLMDCRKEFIAMDLVGMYDRIGEQQEVCRQIQSLQPAIEQLQKTLAPGGSLGLNSVSIMEMSSCTERLLEVTRELEEAQMEVRRLTQIHASYLRRSRRTVQMMTNFVGNYTLTYQGKTPVPPRFEGRG